jgi:hypothetical protein
MLAEAGLAIAFLAGGHSSVATAHQASLIYNLHKMPTDLYIIPYNDYVI